MRVRDGYLEISTDKISAPTRTLIFKSNVKCSLVTVWRSSMSATTPGAPSSIWWKPPPGVSGRRRRFRHLKSTQSPPGPPAHGACAAAVHGAGHKSNGNNRTKRNFKSKGKSSSLSLALFRQTASLRCVVAPHFVPIQTRTPRYRNLLLAVPLACLELPASSTSSSRYSL